MSDFAKLLIGLALLLSSVGALMVLRPRGGKTISWTTKPFVGPLLGVLITVAFGVGIILVAAYFTTIDNMKLSG